MKKFLLFSVGFLLVGRFAGASEAPEYKEVVRIGDPDELEEIRQKKREEHFEKKAKEWKDEREKKAKEWKDEREKKEVEGLVKEIFESVSKRQKIEKEKKRLEIDKAKLEKFKDTKFFLELDGEKFEIKRTGFDLSKWFNDAFDEYSEDKKYFDEQKNEFTLDLDEPLSHLKWKKDFTLAHIKVFIELCDNSDDQLKETLRSIKQEDLIPLILFADYFEVTSSPERGHSPERDILLLLLQELASRITDKDFLDMLDDKNSLVWQIIDELPDGVLAMLKDLVFLDERGKDTIELKGPEGYVVFLFLLPDGRIASAHQGGMILIWDPKKEYENPIVVRGHAKDPIYADLLLPDGKIVLGSWGGKVRVLDPKKPDEKLIGLRGHRGFINSFLLLADGKIASGSDDKTIRIWDLKKEKSAKEMSIAVLEGNSGAVTFLLSLPGDRIAAGSRDGEIRVWNLKKKTSFVLQGHTDRITSLVLLDNNRIASGSKDGTIRIWNLKKKTSFVVKGRSSIITSFILLRDGRIASGSKDGTICIWNPNEKKVDQVLTGHKKKIDFLFLLPDDRIASISQDKTIRIWDLNDGGSSVIFKEDASGFADFLLLLPDGRLAGASTSGTILIWNVFDIFKNLTFKQAALARLLQLNSMEPEEKKRPIFRKRKMRIIFSSLPKYSQQLFLRLGWLVQ